MELNDFNYNYEVKYNDDSKNNNDRWKIYLFTGLKENLRKRLNEMLSDNENKSFFEALKLEYGHNMDKNLKEAFLLYKKSSMANSTNYLSMVRLFDIYRTKNKYFQDFIKNDKNLKLIYLFKSIAYLPVRLLRGNISNKTFPIDLAYTIASFMDNNNLQDTKQISAYIDRLKKSKKYDDIISIDDCNLIKGFLEGYYEYQYEENNTNSINLLLALSVGGYSEATAKLIYLYLEKLNDLKEDDKKNIEILKTKIYDLFLISEKKKFYKIYEQYGLFLYNDLRMFGKALQIFEKGYKKHKYECSYSYFHAFTKSENQTIYEEHDFNPKKFIDIFQCLIDAFLYGQMNSLYNMFDYLHVIGKKYNLFSLFSSRYMMYLNEIALLCESFADKEKGEENMKKFTLNKIETLKYGAYHSLSYIYMYGLTTEVKLHLIKAEAFLKKSKERDEYSHPYYTRLIYKIKKKLFELGVFEDKREVDKYEKLVFKLYEKYKNHDHYGNSYYYYFGSLYEKGIGTEKNNKMALKYYQKGCNSLHNIYDSFIIVFKRFQSLKKIKSNKFVNHTNKSNKTFNINFRLSAGDVDIKFPINEKMTISDIQNELYKRSELQNYVIKILLFQGNQMMENDTIEKFKIKENDTIVVLVGNPNETFY